MNKNHEFWLKSLTTQHDRIANIHYTGNWTKTIILSTGRTVLLIKEPMQGAVPKYLQTYLPIYPKSWSSSHGYQYKNPTSQRICIKAKGNWK